MDDECVHEVRKVDATSGLALENGAETEESLRGVELNRFAERGLPALFLVF